MISPGLGATATCRKSSWPSSSILTDTQQDRTTIARSLDADALGPLALDIVILDAGVDQLRLRTRIRALAHDHFARRVAGPFALAEGVDESVIERADRKRIVCAVVGTAKRNAEDLAALGQRDHTWAASPGAEELLRVDGGGAGGEQQGGDVAGWRGADEMRLRYVEDAREYGAILVAAVDEVRQSARGDVDVADQLLEAVDNLGRRLNALAHAVLEHDVLEPAGIVLGDQMLQE